MKSNSIFLPGDFNCDMLGVRERTERIDNNHETRKLLDMLDLFNMRNVIGEPTSVTLTTQSSIDLIVTTKVNLVSKTGVLPLGLSDHCLIYATIKLNSENPAPKNIRTRNSKHSVMTRNLSRMLIEYHFTSQQFSRTNKIPYGSGNNCSVPIVINTHHTQL